MSSTSSLFLYILRTEELYMAHHLLSVICLKNLYSSFPLLVSRPSCALSYCIRWSEPIQFFWRDSFIENFTLPFYFSSLGSPITHVPLRFVFFVVHISKTLPLITPYKVLLFSDHTELFLTRFLFYRVSFIFSIRPPVWFFPEHTIQPANSVLFGLSHIYTTSREDISSDPKIPRSDTVVCPFFSIKVDQPNLWSVFSGLKFSRNFLLS